MRGNGGKAEGKAKRDVFLSGLRLCGGGKDEYRPEREEARDGEWNEMNVMLDEERQRMT